MIKMKARKYVLVDFYGDEFGELITSSDSIDDINKSAKQHRKDTDDECILICLQWSNELNGFTKVMNFYHKGECRL